MNSDGVSCKTVKNLVRLITKWGLGLVLQLQIDFQIGSSVYIYEDVYEMLTLYKMQDMNIEGNIKFEIKFFNRTLQDLSVQQKGFFFSSSSTHCTPHTVCTV